MEIEKFKSIIQENFSAKLGNELIPQARETLVIRERTFTGGAKMITVLGLAVDYLFMGRVKGLLGKHKEVFTDTCDRYKGEAFIYISFKFDK